MRAARTFMSVIATSLLCGQLQAAAAAEATEASKQIDERLMLGLRTQVLGASWFSSTETSLDANTQQVVSTSVGSNLGNAPVALVLGYGLSEHHLRDGTVSMSRSSSHYDFSGAR